MKLTSDKSFFNNSEDDSIDTPEPQAYPQAKPISEIPQQKKSQSVIGQNIKFRGELIGTEDIHIEGSVEGTIIMEGHNLTIGTEGILDANVHANTITINGQLTGDILADELISIKNSAQVKGNLIAPRIQLDDGGKFRGSMDMVDNEQEKKDSTLKFKEKLIHPHLPSKQPDSKKDSTSNQYSSGKKSNHMTQGADSKDEKKSNK
jgi:cytoskeletal protein CcmA (bactofilin family)